MWARGTPEANDGKRGSGILRMITREITECNSVPELETVFIEHSSSFSYINAAAAITKYVQLRGSSMRSPFFSKLGASWLQQMPEAGTRECANVLWACSKLGSGDHPVWTETWQAFIDNVEKELSRSQPPSLPPQELSNVLYACAKLRKLPQPDELLLLLEAFVHPTVMAAASPRDIANVIWSLGVLSINRGWQAEVSQELLQQLLAPPILNGLAEEGDPQHVSNVLVGLGHMCTGPAPLLSIAAAHNCARQVLSGVRLSSWKAQDITNAMWALSELQLKGEGFFQAAVAAAPMWLPKSTAFDVTQAATACAQLQYNDERFVGMLVQRGQQLLQPSQRSPTRPLLAKDKAILAVLCCISVAQLDMRGLAGAVCEMVASSGIGQDSRTHPASLRKLWVFHSWLLEHRLLDGKGLAGLVKEQQLQQGEKEAAKWGDKTRL
jgi:hypothetical protein